MHAGIAHGLSGALPAKIYHSWALLAARCGEWTTCSPAQPLKVGLLPRTQPVCIRIVLGGSNPEWCFVHHMVVVGDAAAAAASRPGLRRRRYAVAHGSGLPWEVRLHPH